MSKSPVNKWPVWKLEAVMQIIPNQWKSYFENMKRKKEAKP